MTVPTTGAPDWQAPAPWKSGNLFGALTSVYPVGVTSLPVFPSLAFAALQLKFVPTAGLGHVVIHWFTDAAGLNEVGNDSWSVNTAFFLLVIVPTEAAFFSIHVANTGAGNLTALNHAMLVNTPVVRPTYPVAQTQAFHATVAIPASGTSQDTPGHYSKGKGHLRLVPADALGKLNVSVDQVNEAGAVQTTFVLATAFTAEFNAEFAYPDQQIVLNITNTDAGAPHSLAYNLWCADDV